MLAETAKGGARTANKYVARTAYELPHDVDADRLDMAWNSVVSAIPVLRTRIVDLPGEGLVQVVARTSIALNRTGGDSGTHVEPPIMGLGSPLCRATLQESGRTPMLVLEMHHSIFDGWSTSLVLEALEAAYSKPTDPAPTLLPLQPFVKHCASMDRGAAHEFWQDHLQGSEAIVFPCPKYQPEQKIDYEHLVEDLHWPRSDATPANIISGTLALLLASYTNSSDVKFGATVSGRQADLAGIDRVVGPTIATIPVRVSFDWDQTVATLLQRIQQQSIAATPYEQLGLRNIARISSAVEEASQFQLLLVTQGMPPRSQQAKGHLFRERGPLQNGGFADAGQSTAGEAQASNHGIYNSFAMMIICQLKETGVELTISYDTGAMQSTAVARFASQFEHVLRQLCSERASMCKVRDVNPMTEQELKVIGRWNNDAHNQALAPVTETIDKIALSAPSSLAVDSWDRKWTYLQLRDETWRLARGLQSLGVRRDSVVVLSFDRSSWLIVAMLSVLKAGAVALPMASPGSAHRAKQIVANLQPVLVVTSIACDQSPFHGLTQTMNLVELKAHRGEASDPGLRPSSDDPAVILSTSGSTGAPKSIQWTHRTVSSNAHAAAAAFGLCASSRVFQFSRYDYDVSTIEALSALPVGGCLCMPSDSDRSNRLAGAIDDSKANWICLTPSVAETLDPADVPSLRTMSMINWYGPTEAPVATCCLVKPSAWSTGQIGRALPGATIWLVDPKDRDRLAPVGAVAELCIQGPIVGEYSGISGPALNANALWHPSWLQSDLFSKVRSQGPVYRSGDLARYASDGRIVIQGRIQDTQRKLHGQRIDLGDIERCVQSFMTNVRDVSVVAEILTPAQGDNDILALFVSPEDAVLPLDELERFLLGHVAGYMVPRLYLHVPRIPITVSGKTDRRRLREIGNMQTLGELMSMQPRRCASRKPETALERELQQQWAAVLGVAAESIGAADHFLRIGGDSITAMRLVSSLGREGLVLTVTDIFEAPVLEQMAGRLCQHVAEDDEYVTFSLLSIEDFDAARSAATRLCMVSPDQVQDMYPCTALQEGLLALGSVEQGRYVSRSVLNLRNGIVAERLRNAWMRTAEKLSILRTRIVDLASGGGLAQVVLAEPCWRSAECLQQYLADDDAEPMELGTPLCRAACVDDAFILTIHHCLYDGPTLRMMLAELESHYFHQSVPRGNLAPFRLFIQYLQQQHRPAEAAAFWRTQLSRAAYRSFPQLPSREYRPRATRAESRSIPVQWPRATGVTPSTILRATWALLQAHSLATFLDDVQQHGTDIARFEQYGVQNIQNALFSLNIDSARFQTLLVVQPPAEGHSLQADSALFHARSFASTLETRGNDPFNAYVQLEATHVDLQLSFDPHVADGGRIAAQFETLLLQLCRQETHAAPMSSLQTASAADLDCFRSQNDAAILEPDTCVPESIAATARKHPEAVAIKAWDGQFSYHQLDCVSNALAAALLRSGVEPGSVVLLWLEKSKWAAVAYVAALKAGAIALVQDVAVPVERMKNVVATLDVKLAVVSPSMAAPALPHTTCTTAQQLLEMAEPTSSEVPLPSLQLSAPAVVILSSGTTGQPKHIVWSHRALASNVQSYSEYLALKGSARVFQFASYNFDVATVEIVSALARGACLCIPSESERLNEPAAAIARFGANITFLPGSVARMLRPTDVLCLEILVLAGEPVSQNDARRWVGYCRVINWYGPAEFSTASFCDVNDCEGQSNAIGKVPSSSLVPRRARLWLVDPMNLHRLAPFGATGEIVLQGPSCADGYIGDEDLTHRNFCSGLQFVEGGSWKHNRIYRTGDLARYDSSGRLIYVGRNDSQFKIAGQMVSLEEVAVHIERFIARPEKKIAVVVGSRPGEDGSEDTMIAYVTASAKALEQLTIGLYESLSAVLPRYAIPTHCASIDAVPTTLTGKQDRVKLRSMAAATLLPLNTTLRERRLPTTEHEKLLASCWSLVLGISESTLSTTDSFLNVGNSIQAMRLVSLLRDRGATLSVSDIFQNPVLQDMATALRFIGDAVIEQPVRPFALVKSTLSIDVIREEAANACAVVVNDVEDIFPCTPLQEGLLALTAKHQGDYTSNRVLRLASCVVLERFKQAWEQVVASTPTLRTRIIDIPSLGLVQTVIRHHDCWTSMEGEISTTMGLGLPLMRCSLYQAHSRTSNAMHNEDDTFCFALTMQHSIYDGPTLSLIFDALKWAYAGQTPPALLPFQVFLNYIRDCDAEADREFWIGQFDSWEGSPFPKLPTERYKPRPDAISTHSITDLKWRGDNNTPSTIVHVAVGLLCAMHSNSSDVVFGTIVMGRKAPLRRIESVAGPTIATVPLRVKINGSQTMPQLLTAQQQRETAMIPHEQTGLSRIGRMSDTTRRACQFQTLVVIQLPEDNLEKTGLFCADEQPQDPVRYSRFGSYALVIVCTLDGNDLMVEFCYDVAALESTVVDAMLPQLEHILRRICEPELDQELVRDVPWLDQQGKDKIRQWNAHQPRLVECCVHEIFAEVANEHHDLVAVSAWDGELTYSLLDELSTLFAYQLRDSGVSENDSINRFRATDIFLTPSVSTSIDPRDVPTLCNIYIGGEAVDAGDVTRWTPYARTFVVYGPTECSAITLFHEIQRQGFTKPCIGHGLGVSTWVVDPSNSERLMSVGAVGELYLEGPLVGSGYLGDEEKTASVFVPAPSWLHEVSDCKDGPRQRSVVYKTGDLVKYDPADGTLLFVGRKDTQVKLRGQRIELSEVEQHARQCLATVYRDSVPAVVAEIVSPRANARPHLALFLQVDEGEHMSKALRSLEDELSERLPTYMVPTSYIPVPAIPIAPSGKIDRRRLREMGANLSAAEQAGNHIKTPLTPAEQCLRTWWATVLDISRETIRPKDHFVRLGGDSISAMRLAALARREKMLLTVQHILMAPRLAHMAEAMTALQPEKESDVAPFSLLRNRSSLSSLLKEISRQCDVSVAQIEDVFPCTGVQKSLLSMTAKLQGASVARYRLRLREKLNVEHFKAAWETVSREKAPILRTRVVHTWSEDMVQVQVDEPLRWDAFDTFEAYLAQSSHMGLGTPLTRLAMEVSRAYSDMHDASRVPPFQDFMRYIEDLDRDETDEFWKGQFEDLEAAPFPALPHPDYRPKANDTVRRDLVDFSWPQRNVTPSTTIRAAWAVLTSYYTNTDDTLFGTLVAGRQASLPGIERIIAPLINAVPVRVRLDTKQTVDELLCMIQQQSIAMVAHENTELGRIRQIDANSEQASRFNTMLLIQPVRPPLGDSAGPFGAHSQPESLTATMDNFNPNAVMVICQLTEQTGLSLEVSFDNNVISAQQVERMASQFEHILRQLCESTTTTVQDLDLLSTQNLSEIWRWNQSVPHVIHECLHDLISATAQQNPKAPAICSWDGDLLYGELDELSSRLASRLMKIAADLSAPVPLCFEKSKWHPVSALAVMKAGAACVSIDMSQPESRLRSIFEQIKPTLALASGATQVKVRKLTASLVIDVEQEDLSLTTSAMPLPKVKPSDVAYVVFTSGSTGTPKGIVITHANFASAATHQAEMIHIRPTTRLLDFVSYSFDVSWSNLLQTLLAGACLCIPSETERRDDIPGAFNRMNCDYVYLTPSVARSVDPAAFPGLRTLAMGGEPVQQSDVSRWTHVETVLGIYGPAECTPTLSIIVLNANSRGSHIGHSIGANCWVIQPDRPDRLAAIGTVGELMVEGPTVSQGYFGDPDQTSMAYIRDPAWLVRGTTGHPGRHGTLYKTADLVRYNDDGSFDYVGRKDSMVKLRGQRIELGEVEFHLRASLNDGGIGVHGVAAEVITPAKGSAPPILAAFISISWLEESQEQTMDVVDRVHQGMSARVPRYMVPSVYIPVAQIPMTTTNKTDRKALQQLGGSYTLEDLAKLQSRNHKYQPPSTTMEKRLQLLWSAVLGIGLDAIGRDSSFLRIGGESISAMKLVSAARTQNISFTVADVFRAPRLSELALLAEETRTESEMEPTLPFQLLPDGMPDFVGRFVTPALDGVPGQVHDVLPCTDFQQLAISNAFEDPPSRLPQYILTLPNAVDFVKLERACQQVAASLEILRTIFIHACDRLWQVVLFDFNAPFDIFDISGNMSDAVNSLCKEDLAIPRRLGRSFVRFMAVRNSSTGENRLIFRVSHAQFDGFSLPMLFGTLSAFYCGCPLTRPYSFSQYVAYKAQKKQSSLEYWKSRLQGTSYPDWSGGSCCSDSASTSDRFSVEETIAMPTSRHGEGLSIATMFQAACAIAFSRHLDQAEVVFGRLVTGRSMLPPSLQNVVGPCLTEVPVRVRIGPEDTLDRVALILQRQFIEDSAHECAGMQEILQGSTTWREGAEDFGWRTAFQQEDVQDFEFLGEKSRISVFEHTLLPRPRPEIYATPRGKSLHLQLIGNRKILHEKSARKILGSLRNVLGDGSRSA
ncbi:unnamed protein product [Cercospora beticola]|nr:unnamed protein product [Cercospora beticola]